MGWDLFLEIEFSYIWLKNDWEFIHLNWIFDLFGIFNSLPELGLTFYLLVFGENSYLGIYIFSSHYTIYAICYKFHAVNA